MHGLTPNSVSKQNIGNGTGIGKLALRELCLFH